MGLIRWWKRNRVLQEISDVSEAMRKVIASYYEMPPTKRKSDPLARARLELAAEYRAKLIRLKAVYRTLC